MVDQQVPFPKRPILITFDDARIDSFQLADPVLKRYDMKATMFVPTSKTVANHPFFADWDMIRQYRRTNRWDMQSHGHKAHDLIDIDAHGRKGKFLSDYRWLSYQQRHETDDEFSERVNNDYRESIKRLKQQFPGDSIIGYAFPYSEAGQESGGLPAAMPSRFGPRHCGQSPDRADPAAEESTTSGAGGWLLNTSSIRASIRPTTAILIAYCTLCFLLAAGLLPKFPHYSLLRLWLFEVQIIRIQA